MDQNQLYTKMILHEFLASYPPWCNGRSSYMQKKTCKNTKLLSFYLYEADIIIYYTPLQQGSLCIEWHPLLWLYIRHFLFLATISKQYLKSFVNILHSSVKGEICYTKHKLYLKFRFWAIYEMRHLWKSFVNQSICHVYPWLCGAIFRNVGRWAPAHHSTNEIIWIASFLF